MIDNNITVIIIASIILFLLILFLSYLEDRDDLTTYSGNEIYIV
jgi:hypothetical protein